MLDIISHVCWLGVGFCMYWEIEFTISLNKPLARCCEINEQILQIENKVTPLPCQTET